MINVLRPKGGCTNCGTFNSVEFATSEATSGQTWGLGVIFLGGNIVDSQVQSPEFTYTGNDIATAVNLTIEFNGTTVVIPDGVTATGVSPGSNETFNLGVTSGIHSYTPTLSFTTDSGLYYEMKFIVVVALSAFPESWVYTLNPCEMLSECGFSNTVYSKVFRSDNASFFTYFSSGTYNWNTSQGASGSGSVGTILNGGGLGGGVIDLTSSINTNTVETFTYTTVVNSTANPALPSQTVSTTIDMKC